MGKIIAMTELKIFLALMLRGYDYHLESNKKPRVGAVGDGMPIRIAAKKLKDNS